MPKSREATTAGCLQKGKRRRDQNVTHCNYTKTIRVTDFSFRLFQSWLGRIVQKQSELCLTSSVW